MLRCPSRRFRIPLLHCPALLVFAACIAHAATTAPKPQAASVGPVYGSATALEPLKISTRVRRIRLIYTCHEDGAAVYSDRPCGEGATLRTIALAPPVATGNVPDTTPRAAAATTRSQSDATGHSGEPAAREPAAPAPDRCSTLESQLREIDDRMRQGYSAREAARLWNRWREIKEDLHIAHC